MGSTEPSPFRVPTRRAIEFPATKKELYCAPDCLPISAQGLSLDGGGANAYLPEKRKALDAWDALLREIVSDEARASNVVALKGQQ
jgi:hypothetical protein